LVALRVLMLGRFLTHKGSLRPLDVLDVCEESLDELNDAEVLVHLRARPDHKPFAPVREFRRELLAKELHVVVGRKLRLVELLKPWVTFISLLSLVDQRSDFLNYFSALLALLGHLDQATVEEDLAMAHDSLQVANFELQRLHSEASSLQTIDHVVEIGQDFLGQDLVA